MTTMFKVFHDKSGKFSATRFTTIVSVLTFMAVYMMHNIAGVVNCTGVVSLGYQEMLIIASIMGAKVAQRFGERGDG